MISTASKPTGVRQDDGLQDKFIPLPAMQIMTFFFFFLEHGITEAQFLS